MIQSEISWGCGIEWYQYDWISDFLSSAMSSARQILVVSLETLGLGRGKLRPSFFTCSQGTHSMEDELAEKSSLGTAPCYKLNVDLDR